MPFTIEATPPSITGMLHAGHARVYTIADAAARYQRARGRQVWFAWGWDNWEPGVQAYVQRTLGAHPDPAADPTAVGSGPCSPLDPTVPILPALFEALAREVISETVATFEQELRALGVSADWADAWSPRQPRVQALARDALAQHVTAGHAREHDGAWWLPITPALREELAGRVQEIRWHPQDCALADPPALQLTRPGGWGIPVTGGVLDTWGTSALAPAIITGDHGGVDLRIQGRDILRRGAGATILRSHLLGGTAPWREVLAVGWVTAQDRSPMGKSLGNGIALASLLAGQGPDAIRAWALSTAPGEDTWLDPEVFAAGRRLARALRTITPVPAAATPTGPTVAAVTAALDGHDYPDALTAIQALAARPLELEGVGVLARLTAPLLPHAASAAWASHFPGSVHAQPWPHGSEDPC